MARKTPTELAREVQQELGILRSEFSAVKGELDRTDLPRLRERLAVLEGRVDDLRSWKEESGRRLFQFVMLFLGGVVTLAINLAVTFLRR